MSWTFLEDAERDPAGVADCIARRRRARARELADADEPLERELLAVARARAIR